MASSASLARSPSLFPMVDGKKMSSEEPSDRQPLPLELHQLELRYEHLRIIEPRRLARLMATLAHQPLHNPVLVVSQETDPQRFVLIDGYRRVLALKKLGQDTVEAIVLPMTEAQALIFRQRQQTDRPSSALEEAWLLVELEQTFGLSQAELATEFSRSVSWISRRLALLRALPKGAQAVVRRGVVSAQGAMKYLVPLSRAKTAHCETLCQGLGPEHVSVRQLEQLYKAWRSADDATREQIVANPKLYLKVEEEAERPDSKVEPETVVQVVVRELEMLESVGRRVRGRLRTHRRKGIDLCAEQPVRNAWSEFLEAFNLLCQTVERKSDA